MLRRWNKARQDGCALRARAAGSNGSAARSDCSYGVVRRPAPAGNIQRHLLVRDVPARMSAAN